MIGLFFLIRILAQEGELIYYRKGLDIRVF